MPFAGKPGAVPPFAVMRLANRSRCVLQRFSDQPSTAPPAPSVTSDTRFMPQSLLVTRSPSTTQPEGSVPSPAMRWPNRSVL